MKVYQLTENLFSLEGRRQEHHLQPVKNVHPDTRRTCQTRDRNWNCTYVYRSTGLSLHAYPSYRAAKGGNTRSRSDCIQRYHIVTPTAKVATSPISSILNGSRWESFTTLEQAVLREWRLYAGQHKIYFDIAIPCQCTTFPIRSTSVAQSAWCSRRKLFPTI